MDDYQHDLMEMQEEVNTLGKLKGEVRIALEVVEDHLHLLMLYVVEDVGYVMQEDCLADQEA